MLVKNSSDFELTIHRVKSTFKDFQASLEEIKDCPLILPSEMPLITMWTYNKCMKSLLNVFCLPIDFKINPNIRPEDLEEYNFNPDQCKIEENADDSNLPKLQNSDQKGFYSDHFNSSNHENEERNDSPFSGENSSDNRKEYKRGPYKNYTIEEKLAAVKMLLEDHCSVIEVSRKLKIPCKNIKRWSQYGVQRKKGGGRKRFSPETEKQVAYHLKTNFKQGSELEYEKVQNIARQLSDDPAFKASRGWVVKFVDRQHLRNYYKFV